MRTNLTTMATWGNTCTICRQIAYNQASDEQCKHVWQTWRLDAEKLMGNTDTGSTSFPTKHFKSWHFCWASSPPWIAQEPGQEQSEALNCIRAIHGGWPTCPSTCSTVLSLEANLNITSSPTPGAKHLAYQTPIHNACRSSPKRA